MDENASMNLVAQLKDLQFLFLLLLFILLSILEWMVSSRALKIGRKVRWPGNLGLFIVNTLLIRFLFPGAALWGAFWAAQQGFGLFRWVEVPLVFSTFFTVVFLDWMLYYQHRVFHHIPLFWKVHRLHHTDLEVDASTGTRFHPLEALLSALIKWVVIVLLGAPALGVFLFEFIFQAVSFFSHSNVALPGFLDRLLRFIVVTPNMHLVHHSAAQPETDSNFGFIFSWWDRLLRTYKAAPEKGPERMKIGLDLFEEESFLRIDKLLLQPFMDRQGRTSPGNLLRKD